MLALVFNVCLEETLYLKKSGDEPDFLFEGSESDFKCCAFIQF